MNASDITMGDMVDTTVTIDMMGRQPLWFWWDTNNNVRNDKWEALLALIGNRFVIELSDLDDAIFKYRPTSYDQAQ